MPRRRKALLLLALGLFVCGLLVVLTREKEPSYEGWTLSAWITIYRDGSSLSIYGDRAKAADAIRHIGIRGLPFLLRWIDEKPTTWRNKFDTVVAKLPRWIRDQVPTAWLHNRADGPGADNAAWAFFALGHIAAPAVPELTRRVNPSNTDRNQMLALIALSNIGPDAMPALVKVLSEPAQADCDWPDIRHMGTNARPLVPLLVQRLQSRDELVAMFAVQALRELKIEPDLVVPALSKAIQDPNRNVRISGDAAFALGRFGDLARPALPALTNALNDPEPSIREVASNAIAQITTAPGTNAPPR